MKAQVRFSHNEVEFEAAAENHLVVSLEAPTIDWVKKRPLVCVIPVIDVSGSMRSENKMHYTKQSVLKLIDHLQPGDYCGVVTFDSHVTVLQEPIPMSSEAKDSLRVKVGDLKAGGATNFSGGMLAALEMTNKLDLPAGTLVRVIMFTDGYANIGPAVESDAVCDLLKANKGLASVSAFGYGTAADAEFLDAVSSAGSGNYAHIKDPDRALSAFGAELGGLLSTYAQNIKLKVVPQAGHRLKEVVSDVDAEELPGKEGVLVSLGDILSEETRHVVIALELAKQKKAPPRKVRVVDVSVMYETLEDSKVKKHSTDLQGKIRFVKANPSGFDGEADKIVAQAQMVKAQIRAEELAASGDYTAAGIHLHNTAINFNSRGYENLSAATQIYGGFVTNRSTFQASSGTRASVKKGMTRAYAVSCTDDDAYKCLNLCDVATSNSAMDATSSLFQDGLPAREESSSTAPELHSNDVGVGKANFKEILTGDRNAAKKEDPADLDEGGLGKSKSNRW